MAHSISIADDKLYNQIVEYCKLNGLKLNIFVTNMLRDAFRSEQYGDIPFGTVGSQQIIKKQNAPEIPNEIMEHIAKRIDKIRMENSQPLEVQKKEEPIIEKAVEEKVEEPISIEIEDVSIVKEEKPIETPKPKKRRL